MSPWPSQSTSRPKSFSPSPSSEPPSSPPRKLPSSTPTSPHSLSSSSTLPPSTFTPKPSTPSLMVPRSPPSPSTYLITTSATKGRVSLNGIHINESTLFDDASLIVYAIDNFFDPSFWISSLPTQSLTTPSSVIQCQPPNPSRSLAGALTKLRSMGYSLIVAFLDVQLEWGGSKGTTIFVLLDTIEECSTIDEILISTPLSSLIPCHELIPDLFTFTIRIRIFFDREGSSEEGRRERREGRGGGKLSNVSSRDEGEEGKEGSRLLILTLCYPRFLSRYIFSCPHIQVHFRSWIWVRILGIH